MTTNSRKHLKLQTFMKMCKKLTVLSHDPKYAVATMIVTNDFREICAIGYNGNYKGGSHERDSLDSGLSGFLHSEENALFHLVKPYELRENLILLTSHSPCPMCAKRIVNSGIKHVVFDKEYPVGHDQTIKIFADGEVNCEKISWDE